MVTLIKVSKNLLRRLNIIWRASKIAANSKREIRLYALIISSRWDKKKEHHW
jgi:hypothetical protein